MWLLYLTPCTPPLPSFTLPSFVLPIPLHHGAEAAAHICLHRPMRPLVLLRTSTCCLSRASRVSVPSGLASSRPYPPCVRYDRCVLEHVLFGAYMRAVPPFSSFPAFHLSPPSSLPLVAIRPDQQLSEASVAALSQSTLTQIPLQLLGLVSTDTRASNRS